MNCGGRQQESALQAGCVWPDEEEEPEIRSPSQRRGQMTQVSGAPVRSAALINLFLKIY